MTRPKKEDLDYSQFFEYDETSSSCLRWKVSRGRVKQGSIAGTLDSKNQWTVKLNGVSLRAHRLVYILNHGSIPEGLEIDHKDRNSQNNIITNLRAVTHKENIINRVPKQKNPTGFRGVYLAPSGRFRQTIGLHGTTTYLGTYDTQEEAAKAYDTQAIGLHGDFAILNFSENVND